MAQVTRFGKLVRHIRIDNGEVLKDMATHLGVSSSYLSAAENGNREVPEEWFSKLQSAYKLSKDQVQELRRAAEEEKKTIRLNLNSANSAQKEVALVFARAFDDIDENTAKKISKLLEDKRRARL